MPANAPTDVKCEKCGEPAALVNFIPRFGDQPAYHLFECPACKAITWVAEAITGSKSEEG